METSLFIIFIILLSLAVLGIYLSSNPIFAIVSLVVTIILSSLLLFYLGIEFVALILLVVYVGAVSVLFLFVVMLLGTRYAIISMNSLPSWFIAILFILFVLFFIVFFLFSKNSINFLFTGSSLLNDNYLLLNDFNNLTILAYNILSSYYVIMAALILLVAMLGSIFLNDLN